LEEDLVRTTTGWLAVESAAIAIAGSLAAAVPVTSTAGEPPTIAWEPCPQDPAVQCGSVGIVGPRQQGSDFDDVAGLRRLDD
jgi:hypothetical protein